MAEAKKYFWLRLKRDFFKRHDIRIVRGLEHGNEIVFFYIQLLVESIDHEGRLRFNEAKPYNNKMLAIVTGNDEETVKMAMEVLQEFELVQILDDGTIFLPELKNMIGDETEWARKKREWRERKRQEEDTERTTEGQIEDIERTLSDKSKSKSKSKSIERNTKERNGVSLYAFGEFKNVMLTTEEHDKLANEYGLETTKCVLEELSGYLVEHPRKYTNHYLALRNWLLKRREDKKPQPIHCQPPKNPYEIDWKALGVKE